MGLLFNRKTESGAVVNKKFVRDSELHNSDIKKLSRSIGIYNKGGQREIAKILIRDQKGGLKTQEAHDALQELIGKKLIANTAQARSAGKKLGLRGRKMLKFDNLTKYNQKRRMNEAKNNESGHKSVSLPSHQPQSSINHEKEIHKDYHLKEDKNQAASPASVTRLPVMNISSKLSANPLSRDYLQNHGIKNNMKSEDNEKKSEGKKTIYDIIREKNQGE